MPDTTPEQILARAQVPPANGRPVRKDEIELDERGIYIESWLPERRSRRKPLLFVHGELAGSWVWERYLGYFAAPRLGGPRPQPAQPLLVADRRPGDAVVRHLHRGRRRDPRAVRLRRRSSSGTGWAACSRSRPPSGCRSRAWSCSAPSCRASCGRRPGRTSCARSPRSTGAVVIGWETLPEQLRPGRARPDPGRRPAHPAPARPEAARGRRRAAPDAGRRAGRPARRRRSCRGSSSAPGSTTRCR